MPSTTEFDSAARGCSKRSAPQATIPTYDIGSFGAAAASTTFDFAPLEERLHAPLRMPHRHDFYQIVWVRRGIGTHVIDSNVYPVRDDVVFCLSPGQVHDWDLDKAGAGSRGYVFNVGFDFAQVEHGKSWAPLLTSLIDASPIYLRHDQPRDLQETVSRLATEYHGNSRARINALYAYFQLFLVQLDRCLEDLATHQQVDAGTALLQQFRRLVDENYRAQLSPAEYARLLHVRESHLTDTIKRLAGRTPRQLVHDRILLEAKRLLIHDQATISEIAFRLGFNDLAYFSRFFKKGTSRPPTEFRSFFADALKQGNGGC